MPASSTQIAVNTVTETLVPDIRETEHSSPRMSFNGMTVSDPFSGKSTVLLFPEKLEANARQEGVILNETSQAYFSELIPPKILGIRLSQFGIDTKGKGWSLYHVQEAFSDLATLKYGDEKLFQSELGRILGSSNDSYDFSKQIAFASLQMGLEDAKSMKRLTPQNAVQVASSLNPNELKIVKETVIGSYEANIMMIFQSIAALSSKK